MRKSILFSVATLLLAGVTLSAGEKKLMHCFAFTPVEGASQADWQAFFQATDALPKQIPGLSKVWYGKLRRPLMIFNTDAAARKELNGGAKSAKGEVTRATRHWGVCMEFADEKALAGYAKNPAHTKWNEVYSKVRVSPTTTYDILGQ